MSNNNDHIRAIGEKGTQTSRNDGLPQLVLQVRDNALSILLSHLEQLFSSCDDLFFDLSSRANSNNEQNLYFESMREMRIKKNGIITQYRQKIEQLFFDCNHGKVPLWNQNASGRENEDALSLVQHDQIEKDVAISSIVSKARSNNQEALYQLNVRLDFLLNNAKVDASNNPLDPMQLCQAFSESCDLLDINIKAKIILFKQFERLAVSRLANLYSNVNDLLINAGVIPNVSRRIHKSPDQEQSGETTETTAAEEALSAAGFVPSSIQLNELTQLLAGMRSNHLQYFPSYQAYSNNPGPIMQNPELLSAISVLQQQFSSITDELYIHQLIAEVLAQSNPQTPQSVQQSDEDIINLVAMFFDFVIDDRNLAAPVQALIARLQIPILKIALKDKTFFNNSSHPARRLVNLLAELSIGLNDSKDLEKDKTFKLIADTIQEVQENYSSDPSIFAQKLETLEAYAGKDNHRSDLIEKRTQQTEEGQARTEDAKQAAQALLLEKLVNTVLPPAIFEFLVNQWQQLLTLTHLKHGEESTEWVEATQMIDDLKWACNQQRDDKGRQRLEKIKDELLLRVEKGLKAITITDEQGRDLTQAIAAVIAQSQSDTPPRMVPLSREQAIQLGHTPGSGTKLWKDMSALERQQANYKKLTYEFIKKAEEIPLGTWFIYDDIKAGQTQRCKLSARISNSELYVFVNRLGFKVLKKYRKDFAYDMQKGRARILHTEPLIDRALSRIRGKLKQPTGESGNSH